MKRENRPRRLARLVLALAAAFTAAPSSGDAPFLLTDAARRIASWLSDKTPAYGFVLDVAKEPIDNAEVVLVRTTRDGSGDLSPIRARSGPDGRFELDTLEPGRHDLLVWAAGFSPTVVPGIQVPPEASPAHLGSVLLAPGDTLRGRVTTREGRPLDGVEVAVVESDSAGNRLLAALELGEEPTAADRSGEDGAFALTGRVGGERVTLRASLPGYAPVTLPDVRIPAAEPLALVMAPAVTVRGQVTDEAGAPIEGAEVVLVAGAAPARRRGAAPAAARTASAADGGFSFAAAPGPGAVLSVSAPGFLPRRIRDLEVPAAGELDGVWVALDRGLRLEGRAFSHEGMPAEGASIGVVSAAEPERRLTGRADWEGRFVVEGLPVAGPFQVFAVHETYGYAAEEIVTAEDEPEPRIELTLRPLDGAEIAGRVVDESGRGVAGANVRLVSEDERVTFGGPEACRGDGTFLLLAPRGTYRVAARGPGFASSSSEPFTVDQSIEGLEVRLRRGAAVTGSLLGLSFDDLSRVEVAARGEDFREQPGQVRHDGTYRVDGLTPGAWTIQARVAGSSRRASGRLVLEAEQAAELALDFRGGLRLSGEVRSGGAPLAAAVVELIGAERYAQRAGHAGRFLFEGVPAGDYRLRVLDRRRGVDQEQPIELYHDRDVVLEAVEPDR